MSLVFPEIRTRSSSQREIHTPRNQANDEPEPAPTRLYENNDHQHGFLFVQSQGEGEETLADGSEDAMDAGALPPDDNVGPNSLHILFPLFALGIAVWSIRMWTRLRPKARLTSADYIITTAVLAEAACLGLMAAAVRLGWGRHNYFLSDDEIEGILFYTYISILLGSYASWGARISIACLLLQFAITRLWRITIYTTLCLLVIAFLSLEITFLIQCRPIEAIWKPKMEAQCFSKEQFSIQIYGSLGVAILGDLICAILPMLIIRQLSRSVVEKALVSFLMASGVIASVAVGIKIYYQALCDEESPDYLRQAVPEYLWCRIEEIIIIIASCAPLLKTPVERFLHGLGLPRFQNTPRQLNVIVPGSTENPYTRENVERKRPTSEQGSAAPSDMQCSSPTVSPRP